MRFFGTKYASGFLDVPAARVTLFVTTEKSPYEPRRASIRGYVWDTADVETFGPFNESSTAVACAAMGILAAELANPA